MQLTDCTLFDDRMYPNCDRISPQAQLPLKYAILAWSCIPLTVTQRKLALHVFLYTVKHRDTVDDWNLQEDTSLFAQVTELYSIY